ncbi:hypothetical protein [Mucilaginibacter panaciglaebae]|uniref:Uncharacterized protein n=1 Tax=Mucilaginibacter panaciglaebae TaxID=502331 RepID=A0ABP7WIH5_9SPHI
MIRKYNKTNNPEFSTDELELLNLIAELIAEIIIKETDEGDYESAIKKV